MISDVTSTQPTASSPAQALPGGQMGKEEFLTMLVAQLKNQDPMNPMKGDDMAAQLAQFSSLEQLTNISKALELQAASQDGLIATINDTTAMTIIGKSVVAVSDQVSVPADGQGTVQFEVAGSGGLATLTILDDAGKEVGTRPLGFVAAGRHEYELGSAVEGLEAGTYRFAVDVVDTAGKPVPSQTYVNARIDGVRYGANGRF